MLAGMLPLMSPGDLLTSNTILSGRPPVTKRRFISAVIDRMTDETASRLKNPRLASLFTNCFPNTLDTTVFYEESSGKPDTYIITGDIDAMWLRDSSAQVHPYIPYLKNDSALEKMLEGLIRRQARYILMDPYANAFYKDPARKSGWASDRTEMKPGIHERKWELDSLCYPIRLAWSYLKAGGNTSCFDQEWFRMADIILKTCKEQQRKESRGPYSFMRETEVQTDTVPGYGYGNPVKPVGAICSVFRNSDDAATYLFNVPANWFAVVSLRQLAEIYRTVGLNKEGASQCESLADEVENALRKYGIHTLPDGSKIWCYEFDGFGNQLIMDDAGLPSLLSLPYFGCVQSDDEIYRNTRTFVLSDKNPWFFKGKFAEGTGSPHTAFKEKMIWPLGLITRGLTANTKEEFTSVLDMLLNSDAGKGFIHESFQADHPEVYTRDWFAWANTLFGEMILTTMSNHPDWLDLK